MNIESHHMPAVDTYQPNTQQIDSYYINNQPNSDIYSAMRYLVNANAEYRRVKSVSKGKVSASDIASRLL